MGSLLRLITTGFALFASSQVTAKSHVEAMYERQASDSVNTINSTDTTPSSTSCTNSATNRACWGQYNIGTDYYNVVPNTGVTREYWLDVTNQTAAPDGVMRDVLLVNGSLPGPTLQGNWGDNFVIHVRNSLAINGSTIHWHGIRQNWTNQNDGVPSVTQCPIAPGYSYTYKWRATEYGTSWYHSHFGLQPWEGVFGGILINGPATANYDEDKGVLFLNDWTHATSDALYEYALTTAAPIQDNGLINGTNVWKNVGSRFQTTFVPGKKYRIRLINGAMNTPFNFQIDDHNLTIIAADFTPVQPYTVNYVTINVGQRYDIIVTANQPTDNYWMRSIPQVSCSVNNTNANNIRGIVRYGASTADPTTTGYAAPDNCNDPPNSELVPYLQQNIGAYSTEEDLEVTLTKDSAGIFLWYLDGSSMNVPWTNPTLQEIYQGQTSFNTSANVYELPTANVWVYVIIETTFAESHPMHLHGHDFAILASGTGSYASAKPTLQTNNPTRRDTATLPSGGYLVIAFLTSNPGAWLLHCHIGWHVEAGFAVQFIERYDEIKPLIDENTLQSTCSTWDAHRSANDVHQDDSGV